MTKPPATRTLTLPALPRLMPLAFMARAAARTAAARSAIAALPLHFGPGALQCQAVADILAAGRLLRFQQAFDIEGADGRSVRQDDGLGMRLEAGEALAAGIEHHVHDEFVGDADGVAFLKPGRVDVLGHLVREQHQSLDDALGSVPRRWHEDVDGSALVAERIKGIVPNQQILGTLFVQRSDDTQQIVEGGGPGSLLFSHGVWRGRCAPCAPRWPPARRHRLPRGSDSDRRP